jgi:hypothetical protein
MQATMTTTSTTFEGSPLDLAGAEELTHQLKKLLVRSEPALERSETAKAQIERLERWMESYRRGQSAACKIAENGSSLLHEARDQLRLSLEELQRLESEGGPPATKEQVQQADDLAHAIRRIDKLLPTLEHAFHCSEAHEHELEPA